MGAVAEALEALGHPVGALPEPRLLADLFVRSGLCTSRSDARRQAAQGALSLDGARVDDVDAPFAPASDIVMLRFGKKKHRRVRVS